MGVKDDIRVEVSNSEISTCLLFYFKGSMHDVTVVYGLLSHLLKGSITIGDKGYISSKLEEFLKKIEY